MSVQISCFESTKLLGVGTVNYDRLRFDTLLMHLHDKLSDLHSFFGITTIKVKVLATWGRLE
jgi:hypothetical protein